MRRSIVALAALLFSFGRIFGACTTDSSSEGCLKFAWQTSSYTDQFTNAPTSAEQSWFQSHMFRITGYTTYWDWRLAWFPNSWVYQDSSGLYNPSAIASQHPEWILHNQNGHPLYLNYGCSNGSCPQYAPDYSNGDFQQWWIATARSTLAKGYKGIFIDDVNLMLNLSNGSHQDVPVDNQTGLPMTESAWEQYLANFLTAVRQAFPNSEIVHNSLWYAGNANPAADPSVTEQIKAANYINLERGFADTGLTGDGGFWSIQNLFAVIDQIHSLGANIIAQQYDFDDEFSLASYYLINNGHDLFGNNAASPANWAPEYDIDLGRASGSRQTWNKLIRRDFASGMVLINPPGNSTVTVQLPGAYLDIQGNQINSVTLPARQGAVLQKVTAPDPPPPASDTPTPPAPNPPEVTSAPPSPPTPSISALPAAVSMLDPPAPAAVGLTVATTVARQYSAVVLRATIAPSSAATGDTVTFQDSSTAVGTSTIGDDGSAQFSTRDLSVGVHNLSAVYFDPAALESSVSNVIAVIVVPPPSQSTQFTIDPLVLAPGDALGSTQLHWNAPRASMVELHIGAPDGPLFARLGSPASASTGSWVSDGMIFFLQDVSGGKPLTPANTLAFVRARATNPSLVGTLAISPDPIYARGPFGTATLAWNTSTSSSIELHVNSPDGPLLAGGGSNGTATATGWVTDGMTFYLQDVSQGRTLASANTIATVTAQVLPLTESGYLLVKPGPASTDTPSVTLTWSTTTADTVQIRVGSPNGSLFVQGGSQGTATASGWITDGMQFYLQDASSGSSSPAALTIATQTVNLAALSSNTFFEASPNPIVSSAAGLGSTTLYWNVPTTQNIEIRVGAPSGTLLVTGGSSGSATASGWVRDGLIFYLQDVSNGNPLTPDHTLATVTVHIK